MRNNETEQIEYKRSLAETREVIETVAAFATAGGGIIEVGVSPDGKESRVAIGKKTLELLANQIKENTSPPQYPSITYEGPEHSAIIRINVEESPVKPVWAYNTPIKRVGRTNQRIAPDEAKRLMEITLGRTWDAMICEDMGVKDIDPDAIKDFLRRCDQDQSISITRVLENLKLIKAGSPSNGAALLFARNPQRFFVEAQVKCGRFSGTTSAEFLDEKTIEGNLFYQLAEAMAFIKRNTRQAIVISGKPERDIVPEYPEEAVREAVINAICHRDYTQTGTVQVRIYDDRLEVWNPGFLPPDLPLDQLYREHPSRPRNPNIAAALHRARLIEHWGTGTIRIMESCEKAGMPKPEFIQDMGTFIVRFAAKTTLGVATKKAKTQERWQKTQEYISTHGSISLSEYRALFRLGKSQSQRDLSAFVQAKLLTPKGKGPATRYFLSAQ